MRRKDFIRMAALTGGYIAASGSGKPASESSDSAAVPLVAKDLQAFLTSLTLLKPRTVDRFIIGDPATPVKKIGTCWMSDWKTCKKAVEAGVNVLITHEPTFYTHWDLDEKTADYHSAPEFTKKLYLEQVERKKKWLEENKLVIIRNHDTLDALKDKGIPFAFGAFLGFTNKDIINSRTYYNVYKVEKQTAAACAKKIAAKLAEIGQPGVAFYGDPERIVSSVGLGTGCICDPMEFADLKPDLAISIDDTVRTWTQTTFASDTGNPLIVINHGTSEEMGMRSLNQIIREKYPEAEVIHFSQGCSYKWITA
jgi:putative NIF3 family GTP cyclohydrolase 1 type 2